LHNLDEILAKRPIVVALAGSNGAGKSTFYETVLSRTGLLFVNADVIAAVTGVDAYAAADLAEDYRQKFVDQRESFIFETVFSDPVGEKLQALCELEETGYTVLLIYIGIAGPDQSATRVAMRVAQGGHDVPISKIADRYQRTLKNLSRALDRLRNVLVYDNSDLIQKYRLVVRKLNGVMEIVGELPTWLKPHIPGANPPRHLN
jgi:predicted ABC-type ATPase